MTDIDEDLDMDPAWLTKLAGDLKELERTDPKVAEAKRKLDAAAKKLLSLPLPEAFRLIDQHALYPFPADADPTKTREQLQPAVHDVAEALRSGKLPEADVARWVAIRLQDFKEGEPFKHETSFCALVVALELLPTPSAKGFIESMAASQAPELPLLPKVAAEVLKARAEAKLDPAPETMQLVGQGECHCGVSYIVVRLNGKDSIKHKVPVCELFDKTGRVVLNRKEQRALEARKK